MTGCDSLDPRANASVLASVLLLALTLLMVTSLGIFVISSVVPMTPPPQVSWTIATMEGETVSIEHDGGPAVDGNRVLITVDDWERPMSLAKIGPNRWMSGTHAVIPVDQTSGSITIRVWWHMGGDRYLLLRETRISEMMDGPSAVGTDLG